MNNGLARKEKQCLRGAMELVADRSHNFSCLAILSAADRTSLEGWVVRSKYSDFYNKSAYMTWLPSNRVSRQSREWRLTLLAWFAEVGPRGIDEQT